MSVCGFCGSGNDVMSFKLKQLEGKDKEPEKGTVCKKCWNLVVEICSRVNETAKKQSAVESKNARDQLISDLPDETINAAEEIVLAIQNLYESSGELSCSLDGRAYLFMHQIRETANESLHQKNQRLLSPQAVGSIIRNRLHLEVGKRQGKGVPVYVNNKKIEFLFDYIST